MTPRVNFVVDCQTSVVLDPCSFSAELSTMHIHSACNAFWSHAGHMMLHMLKRTSPLSSMSKYLMIERTTSSCALNKKTQTSHHILAQFRLDLRCIYLPEANQNYISLAQNIIGAQNEQQCLIPLFFWWSACCSVLIAHTV